MNIKDVKERVKQVRKAADGGDYERAHALEDALRAEVLTAIARGECVSPWAMADAALQTRKIDFPRWCA